MKNNSKTVLRFLIIFILIISAGIAIFKITKPTQFMVSEIVIEGNKRVSSDEIIKRTGFIAEGTSMFFLESEVIKKIKVNPWINSVKIKKEYPGRIFINISEYDPFCIFKTKNDSPRYMDQEGKKLGTIDVKEGLDFPIIFSDGISNSD
ncbi:MAG: cell division protein FtsQ/DivIB, partial [Thermodesulfobacteriota bacterium]